MTLQVDSPTVYTSQGVPISVTGIAQVSPTLFQTWNPFKRQWFLLGKDSRSEWRDAPGRLRAVSGKNRRWNLPYSAGNPRRASARYYGLNDCGGDLQRQKEVQQTSLRSRLFGFGQHGHHCRLIHIEGYSGRGGWLIGVMISLDACV